MEYNPIIFKVSPHPFYWKVKFTDGEVISQYTDDGTEVMYQKVIDKTNAGGEVILVEWYPTYEGLPVFKQEINPTWQRPVVFRRGKIKMDGSPPVTIFALGWQATIDGKNYKSIMYIDLAHDEIITKSE